MADPAPSVSAHYSSGTLESTLFAALRAAGKDPDALRPEDLAAVDQLHTGGRDATLRLIARSGIPAGASVVDVGGGLGGSARALASEANCTVTVLDLTEEFCRVGQVLTARTGLSDKVTHVHGNALHMPFADGQFDAAWMQHSSLNIPDKPRLYAEIFRVVRPGGRLVLHDIFAGPVQPLHFPVPWARDPSISFLLPVAEARALLAQSGFREVSWEDTTAESGEWFQRMREQFGGAGQAAPALGIHVVLGSDFAERFQNQARNTQEQRTVNVNAVLERP